MKVAELMTREIRVCHIDDTINRAAQIMWERDCGFVPVVGTDGDGALLGVVTDREIAMATYTQGKAPNAIPVAQVMARKVVTCNPDDDILRAEALMQLHRLRRIPVVDHNGRPVGILSLNDIAREVGREKGAGHHAELSADSLAATLAAICQPRFPRESSPMVDLEYVQ